MLQSKSTSSNYVTHIAGSNKPRHDTIDDHPSGHIFNSDFNNCLYASSSCSCVFEEILIILPITCSARPNLDVLGSPDPELNLLEMVYKSQFHLDYHIKAILSTRTNLVARKLKIHRQSMHRAPDPRLTNSNLRRCSINARLPPSAAPLSLLHS